MNITIISPKVVLTRDYQTLNREIIDILKKMDPGFSPIHATYVEDYPKTPGGKSKALLSVYCKWESKEPMSPKYALTYYRDRSEGILELNLIVTRILGPTLIRIEVYYGIPDKE